MGGRKSLLPGETAVSATCQRLPPVAVNAIRQETRPFPALDYSCSFFLEGEALPASRETNVLAFL